MGIQKNPGNKKNIAQMELRKTFKDMLHSNIVLKTTWIFQTHTHTT